MNRHELPNKTPHAPFPWFGGKRRVSGVVWERLGACGTYIEPFAGSIAVLLGNPNPQLPRREVVNDVDGHIVNVWRAIKANPDEVAVYCTDPVHELTLHARNAVLADARRDLVEALRSDPHFYNPELAGWWIWGCCSWIGDGWADKKTKTLPHLGDAGRGVHRPSVDVRAWMRALSMRLGRTVVTCGDWSRVLSKSVTRPEPAPVGVFFDPPYSRKGRGAVYHTDNDVTASVRAWCLDRTDTPLRIALCGYAPNHSALESAGWSRVSWTGSGYARAQESVARTEREAIWFSPACVDPSPQGVLF